MSCQETYNWPPGPTAGQAKSALEPEELTSVGVVNVVPPSLEPEMTIFCAPTLDV
jgi:hypothetical protein